ncbi:MAG: hypothetical protein ABEI97_00975 [Candidatus Nanohaloarchaea archaeon]
MPETHDCPRCRNESLSRTAAGIWRCSTCGHKLAGGAYEPDTGAEELLRRAKKEGTEELEAAQEEVEA